MIKQSTQITAVPASFQSISYPFLESLLFLISHSYKLKCLQISVFLDYQHVRTILLFISPSKDLRLPLETDPQIWHGSLSSFTSRLRNAQSWPKRRMSTTRSQEPRMYRRPSNAHFQANAFCNSLSSPRKVIFLGKAGSTIEKNLSKVVPCLEVSCVVVDSRFRVETSWWMRVATDSRLVCVVRRRWRRRAFGT